MSNPAKAKSSFFSWSTAGRIGFTLIFAFWIYLIWTSTADLDKKLNAATDQNAAIHAIQVDFKNEVQEWKDLLLRSISQDTLNKNWQSYETKYLKVSVEAQAIIRLSETPVVIQQMKTFVDAHAANREKYKNSQDLLIKNNFDPHPADTAVKGIDGPLLDQLVAVAVIMDEDKKRIDKGLVDLTRSDIEEKLLALAFLAVLAIWIPRY